MVKHVGSYMSVFAHKRWFRKEDVSDEGANTHERWA